MMILTQPSANRLRFRAWHKSTGRMVDLHAITPLALDASFNQDGVFIPFSDEIIVMQSTGLEDKNGKEIFEGDIDKRRLPIEWFRGGFICNGQPIGLDCSFTEETWVEIIGNIHQNPDLLPAES